MGAAGLTSSSVEMAARAGTGLELDLTLVPQRETNMTAYEMLLSESQERMLIVAREGREKQVVDIFNKWDLDAVVIGHVVEGDRLRIHHNGELKADLPVLALTEEAPKYERPMASPKTHVQSPTSAEVDLRLGTLDLGQVLKALLASPNICSKHWVYEQYDTMVRTNTVILPGADAAVIRIKETRRAIAMCLDGNGKFVAINAREGAKIAVAEAARNVVCVGAKPIAVTNCLNFASPERPEVMWSFSEVVDGMSEACRAFETPVVSGNVSFYNETDGKGILPTPVIGMVGMIEDTRKLVTTGFKHDGDVIAVLGVTRDDLAASEYAQTIAGLSTDEIVANGFVPMLDLALETKVQETMLRLADECLLHSAHDCSDGGLAVAIAECCFSSLNHTAVGCEIDVTDGISAEALLFGETPSRIVVSFDPNMLESVRRAVADCPFEVIGRVAGDSFELSYNGESKISVPIGELEAAWCDSLGSKLDI
jgi:phosphoribosylformylglycinamidine synthase